MSKRSLARGTVQQTTKTSVRRSNPLHQMLPSTDPLAEVDRRIEVLTGYMGRSHDHALRVIEHALSRGEKP